MTALPVGAATQEQAIDARFQEETDLCQSCCRVKQLHGVLWGKLVDISQFGHRMVARAEVSPQGTPRPLLQVRTPAGADIDQVPALLTDHARHDLPRLGLVIAEGDNPAQLRGRGGWNGSGRHRCVPSSWLFL